MAKVAADLQNIAATLAEAQRSGHVSISGLNARLVQIDNTIAAEIARAQADGVQLDWSALKAAAIDATKGSLGEMTAVRDAYASKLDEAELDMAADGYDMDAIAGGEGEGKPSAEDQARGAADRYDEIQRAQDEALVNSGGPMTPEMQAAAARLRDFGIVNDPNANPYAKQYAGERLSDYNMSRFVGPLPVDPVLGRDARQLAQSRLEFQQKLEAGLLGSAPMSPDAATAFLDSSETQARSMVLSRAEQQLREMGLSDSGVLTVMKGLGSLVRQRRHRCRAVRGLGGDRQARAGRAVQGGRGSASRSGESSARSATSLSWSSRASSIPNNDWNPNEELGKAGGGVLGSMLGGAGAGAAVGSFGGPFTAAGAAVIGGLLGGFAGSDIGGGHRLHVRPATL